MIGTGSLHFIWSQLTNKNQSFKIILIYSWVQSHHLFEPVQNLLLGAQEEGLLKRHSDKFATERHAASFLVFVLIANVFVRVYFFRQNKITHRPFHSDLCFPAIPSYSHLPSLVPLFNRDQAQHSLNYILTRKSSTKHPVKLPFSRKNPEVEPASG